MFKFPLHLKHMRLEILAGSENPVYYPINKSKMVLGSDLSCDIVVSEDEISRKHITLVQEGDNYYVIDQGSTNGSYLNEERLIPGRRVEFTSYFPVRLGSAVLMSLVSDDDAAEGVQKIAIPFPSESSAPKKSPLPQPRASDRTSVISLKDLQGSSTKNLVKKRDEIKKKTLEGKNTKKKKKKSFQLGLHHLISILIIAGAAYLTFNKSEDDQTNSPAMDKSVKVAPAIPEKPKIPVPPSLLSMLELFEQSDKCTTPEETILCNAIPEVQTRPWGVIAKEQNLFVLVDMTPYWQKALENLPPPQPAAIKESQSPSAETVKVNGPENLPPESQQPVEATPNDPFANLSAEEKLNYEKELWEISIGFFLSRGIKNEDYQQFQNKTINFAFFLRQDGLPALKATSAITPEALKEVRRLATAERLSYISQSRALVMNFRKDLYDFTLF